MAATAKPYGMKPVGLIGGQAFVASTRAVKIASGYASDIFNGQPVSINSSGVLIAFTGTTALPATGILGVFVGCSYTDARMGKVFSHYWPSGQVASDAEGYVIDDPDVVFQMQADGSLAQTALGTNIAFGSAAGSTATGNATTAASASSSAVTATLPLRIVGFVEGPFSAPGDAFTDILVKWNVPSDNGSNVLIGGHCYDNPVGL